MAITIQVQAIDRFGVEVGSAIGRNESSPLGVVVSCVTVVQASFSVVVIAPVADGVREPSPIFYHFPRRESRKSLPGCKTLGGLAIMLRLERHYTQILYHRRFIPITYPFGLLGC